MKNNMIENFRRLWPILMVWGLVDLIAGPVMTLLSSNSDMLRQNMFNAYTTGNGGMFIMVVNVAFAVVTGIAVFRYAHSSGALSIMHALPISRAKLFLSNWLSGLIFIAIPQILMTLCLLPFAKFSFAHLSVSRTELSQIDPIWDRNGEHIMNAAYHTDAGDLLRFLILVFVTTFFIYSITVLAGVITGNLAMHLVVTAFINVIVPIMFFIVISYCSLFLYGYTYQDMLDGPGFSWMSPLFMYYDNTIMNGNIYMEMTIFRETLSAVVFTAIALGLSALAFALYRKFKSERAGNSFTFNVAEQIVVIAVTLIGMSVGAALFIGFSEMLNVYFLRVPLYIGAFVGSVITFIIATMIARKRVKVFNMRLLKNFGIYAICAVIFLVFTTTDITGFAKRVPDAKSVVSVKVDMGQFDLIPYRWDSWSVTISDKAGVNAVRELHSLIANSNRAYTPVFDREMARIQEAEKYSILKTPFYLFKDSIGLSVNYKRTARRTLKRHYSLNTEITDIEEFRNLVGSPSWREASSIDKRYGYKNLMDLDVITFDHFGPYLMSNNEKKAFEKTLTKDEVRELAKLLDEDYKNIPTEDLINLGASGEILTFAISRESPDNRSYSNYTYYVTDEDLRFFYSVTDKYVNTIAWLKDKGYYDDMIAATALLKEDVDKVNMVQ